MLGRHVQSLFGECSIVKNKKWANILMMFWGMMFAGVIGAIENTLVLKILELALCVPTCKPMKAGVFLPGGT
jgi:hypothetical protein